MAKMSEDKGREFQELSSYLNFFATAVWGIPEDDIRHPSHYLRPVPGKVSKSMLLAGLRQAVNDTIEATQDFSPEQVGTFDAACRKKLVLTLSEVRSRYWRKYKKIIDRRRIYNDSDYYLAVGVLNDMAATINPFERELLQSLVSAYEEHLC